MDNLTGGALLELARSHDLLVCWRRDAIFAPRGALCITGEFEQRHLIYSLLAHAGAIRAAMLSERKAVG